MIFSRLQEVVEALVSTLVSLKIIGVLEGKYPIYVAGVWKNLSFHVRSVDMMTSDPCERAEWRLVEMEYCVQILPTQAVIRPEYGPPTHPCRNSKGWESQGYPPSCLLWKARPGQTSVLWVSVVGSQGINATSEAFWSTEPQDNSSLFCFLTALDVAAFNVC